MGKGRPHLRSCAGEAHKECPWVSLQANGFASGFSFPFHLFWGGVRAGKKKKKKKKAQVKEAFGQGVGGELM